MTGSSFRLSFLTLIVLFPLTMATDRPLPLSAILGCKNAIATMTFSTDRCLDIEVEGSIKDGIRSQYSVRLYVADKEVAKSTTKCHSSMLKWEWSADNQM